MKKILMILILFLLGLTLSGCNLAKTENYKDGDTINYESLDSFEVIIDNPLHENPLTIYRFIMNYNGQENATELISDYVIEGQVNIKDETIDETHTLSYDLSCTFYYTGDIEGTYIKPVLKVIDTADQVRSLETSDFYFSGYVSKTSVGYSVSFQSGENDYQSFSTNITFVYSDKVISNTMKEYDNANVLLKTQLLEVEALDQKYQCVENTEYVLIETVYQKLDGTYYTKRTLVNKNDEQKMAKLLYDTGGMFLKGRTIEIKFVD